MQRLLISCVVVAVVSLGTLKAQEPANKAKLTGEDVEKAVEFLNTGIKQSRNGKLKKEFKNLLALLESSDSKVKVDLRAFPLIDPDEPVEGQIGLVGNKRWTVLQVISKSEMLVAPKVTTTSFSTGGVRIRQSFGETTGKPLKINASTKGLVDDKELPDGIPGVFLVTGTETYATSGGGSNTVWVLKPFDIEEAAVALKESRDRPKRPAEPKDAKKPLTPADQERLESLRKQKAELERQRLAKEAQKAGSKDEKKPAAKEPAKP